MCTIVKLALLFKKQNDLDHVIPKAASLFIKCALFFFIYYKWPVCVRSLERSQKDVIATLNNNNAHLNMHLETNPVRT